jgi:hypothetical protein
MPSVLRKHLVDSSWLTLAGAGFLRSSCGLAADWASSADHWAALSRHSLSVIKDGPSHALVEAAAALGPRTLAAHLDAGAAEDTALFYATGGFGSAIVQLRNLLAILDELTPAQSAIGTAGGVR